MVPAVSKSLAPHFWCHAVTTAYSEAPGSF